MGYVIESVTSWIPNQEDYKIIKFDLKLNTHSNYSKLEKYYPNLEKNCSKIGYLSNKNIFFIFLFFIFWINWLKEMKNLTSFMFLFDK